MKFLWPLFIRCPSPARVRNVDAELTRTAAELLRAVGCVETAARVTVAWHARLSSTAGLARPTETVVLLNPRLGGFPGELDRTLRHELAHLVAHVRARGRRITAHGPEWRKACADLGIPGETRCHTLPLPRRQVVRRYAYQCPRCGYVLRRTRPIKARRRLACHDCCKQHARGRFDGRFEFVQVHSADAKTSSGHRRTESMVQQTLNLPFP